MDKERIAKEIREASDMSSNSKDEGKTLISVSPSLSRRLAQEFGSDVNSVVAEILEGYLKVLDDIGYKRN